MDRATSCQSVHFSRTHLQSVQSPRLALSVRFLLVALEILVKGRVILRVASYKFQEVLCIQHNLTRLVHTFTLVYLVDQIRASSVAT